MLFSEIYSSYYNVVAAILKEATRNSLTGQMLNDIVQSKAFAEEQPYDSSLLEGEMATAAPRYDDTYSA